LTRKFGYLNRTKDDDKLDLFQKIKTLPFIDYPEDFEKIKKDIEDSVLSEPEKEYLEEKFAKKEEWIKCYFKSSFCACMSTSSRIEAKHRVYKEYLDSSSRLTEIFKVFLKLENIEITKYYEGTKVNKSTYKESDLIKQLRGRFSLYIINKMIQEEFVSINYSVDVISPKKW
jgi:hypothetical protein